MSAVLGSENFVPPQRGDCSLVDSPVVRRLVAARITAGLTVGEVAAASGLSEAYLTLVENGETVTPISTTTHIGYAIAQASYDKED